MFQKCPEKIENLNLIKLLQKPKGANRKGHTNLFVRNFSNLNLLPIDSELNCASANQTYLYQKFGVVPGKVAKRENMG